jgi:outer membrane protein assembly factor BamB
VVERADTTSCSAGNPAWPTCLVAAVFALALAANWAAAQTATDWDRRSMSTPGAQGPVDPRNLPPGAKPVPAWNGIVLWSAALADAPEFPPAFNTTYMFAFLRDGSLVAFDHRSGRQAWSVTRTATVAPAAVSSLMIGADGPTLFALDAATGTERWSQAIAAAPILPLVASADRVIAATDSQEIVLLNAGDGRILWRAPLGATPTAVPVALGDTVFAGLEDGRVVALDAATGAPRWTRTLGARIVVMTALEDRVLVGGAGDFYYSLKPKDGGIQWKWRTGGDALGIAVADAKRVYFVSLDNMVRALDRRGGDLKWQRPMPSRPVGGPLFIGGFLVVAQVSPELRCFDPATGLPACTVGLPGRPLHRPFLPTEGSQAMPRLVFLSGGGQAIAVGPSPEPPLEKWKTVPGTDIGRETEPANPLPVRGKGSWPEAELVPLTYAPGRVLGPELLPAIRRLPPMLGLPR